ncbi:nitrogen fixation protein NifM [Dickeya dianthicola]|uniref:peptidylprolyl isomerase n=1 Tax=Dickeya dianthicola TaxID=204039 RepID=A0ABX9NUW9_9GAMM|nr:nitrogen fixation protein NifM [Dickeya dianthicola]ATO34905.1 NifM protein [Dickeya dianthicola RNS04.9]MCA7004450.1 nitrogen fixation protein NifM [Dickeya dianthicola]MCI4068501.1 nitrogen fixation protein NifM [Dickeya dianthicola]MCI4113035.1 nitrogen fixation protein NifM [Dickeya dianthicola]MCI4118951.1 nitrogen fixation protein NifM [Dickeya dianthicola]
MTGRDSMAPPAWQRFSRLRLAQTRWHCAPEQLPEPERPRFERQLLRQLALEQAVTAAARRQSLTATAAQLQQVAQQLAQELVCAGFSAGEQQAIVLHHTLMELQLASVGAQADEPQPAEIQRWYQQHADRFRRPEQRLTRHLLLTVDDNRPAVEQQMAGVLRQLRAEPDGFASLAQRHSHCPTALDGGLMGWVSRGLLFPALERCLFALAAGELSEPVETELGLHLLRCDAIRPAAPLPEAEALAKAGDYLRSQHQRRHQRRWLQTL